MLRRQKRGPVPGCVLLIIETRYVFARILASTSVVVVLFEAGMLFVSAVRDD